MFAADVTRRSYVALGKAAETSVMPRSYEIHRCDDQC